MPAIITRTRTCTRDRCTCGVKRRAMARAAGAAAGCLLSLAALALLVSLALSGGEEAKAEEALTLNKELEFAAIQAVLRHLDDNHDGSVDLQESEEFVQMELQETTEKSHRFHETDSQITSEELWQSWQQNEVFYWTNADVLEWLLHYVELPQYKDVFYKRNISGRHLPRLANNTDQILQTVLGVTDSQHKQKIRLRAMDVVLFGPPNGRYSQWKDIVVVLSVSLCVVGVVYALRQRRETQRRIDTFLESFREKERELRLLQERLDEQNEATDDCFSSKCPSTPSPSPSPESEVSLPPFSRDSSSQSSSFDTSLTRAHEEIEALRREVDELTSQLSSHTISQSMLQNLLQESCRCEREHVERRRREAQDEITRAQKVCDKIKRRRSSLFGTFHLANSSALEEAGLQITRAINNMHKVSESFEEYHQRWRRIEQVCNFSIVSAAPPTSSLSFTTSPAIFSIPHNSSSSSLKSLDRGDLPPEGFSSARESFSRHSDGYGSSSITSSNSLSFLSTTPDGSPKPSQRQQTRILGRGSLECDSPSSTSSLHNHQISCPAFSSMCKTGTLPNAVSRGRANTLPPTSSLPRNFTVSGNMVSRHDSYNSAVEHGSSSSINSDSAAILRGRRRSGDGGRERLAATGKGSLARRKGRDGGRDRRSNIQRQLALSLSAVHEERGDMLVDGIAPVATTTTRVRGGVTRISNTLTQSTV